MKKILCMLMVLMLAMGIAAPAFAAQSQSEADALCTKEALTEIVEAALANSFANVKASIAGIAKGIVQEMLKNPDAIVQFATPIIQTLVKSQLTSLGLDNAQLSQYIDDAVVGLLTNQVLTDLLTAQFTQDVVARTIDYAVSDIVDALKIDEQQQLTVEQWTDAIYGLGLQNVQNLADGRLIKLNLANVKVKAMLPLVYLLGKPTTGFVCVYSFTVNSWYQNFLKKNDSPKEITVTGWDEKVIGDIISGAVSINTAINSPDYLAQVQSLDLNQIVLDAFVRAIKDQIAAEATKILVDIQNKFELYVEEQFKKIGLDLDLNLGNVPALDGQGSVADNADVVVNAVKAVVQQTVQAAAKTVVTKVKTSIRGFLGGLIPATK